MVYQVKTVVWVMFGIILEAFASNSKSGHVTKEKRNGTDIDCLTLELRHNTNISISERDTTSDDNVTKVWIGAFVNYTSWMEYQGCKVFKQNINPKPCTVEKSSNLYDCYHECTNSSFDYDYIGIQQNVCFCLKENDLESIKSNHASGVACEENPSLICSQSIPENRTVVVYALKRNTGKVNSTQLGSCGVFRFYDSISIGSQPCDDKAFSVCNSESQKTNIGYNSEKKCWEESMNCSLESLKPSSVANLTTGNTNNMSRGDYWTTSIRGSKFFSYDEGQSLLLDKFCAVAEIRNGTIFKVYAEYCTKQLHVLCQSDIEQNQPDENTSMEPGDLNLTTFSFESNDNGTAFPLLLVIGSTGSFVLVVCVTCLVIYCCKKAVRYDAKNQNVSLAGTERKGHIGNPTHTTEFQDVPESSTEKAGSHIETKPEDENVYNQTEFVTERNITPSDYDTMASIRADTEDIYDEASQSPDVTNREGVYDMAVQSSKNQEDTYDVSNPSKDHSIGIYDTSVVEF